MARTLKLVFTIFLVVFLLFITEEVVNAGYFPFVLKPTNIKCKSAKDCPQMIKPNIFVVVCAGGFCQEPAY
jgi:hypothetical protein